MCEQKLAVNVKRVWGWRSNFNRTRNNIGTRRRAYKPLSCDPAIVFSLTNHGSSFHSRAPSPLKAAQLYSIIKKAKKPLHSLN